MANLLGLFRQGLNYLLSLVPGMLLYIIPASSTALSVINYFYSMNIARCTVNWGIWHQTKLVK